MIKFSYLCLVALIAIYGLQYVNAIDDKSTESEEHDPLVSVVSDSEQNLTNPRRTGRILKYPRTPAFTLRRRQPVKIRSRSDIYPIRSQIRRVQNGVLPQNQPIRYGYDSMKSSKYNLPSKGSSLAYGHSAKGSSLRQQLLSGHPNGVHPNGVHVPALSQQYVQNFKASPNYNGKVVVHPVTGTQQSTQQKVVQQDTNYPKYIKPPPPQQQQQQQQQQQHQHQQQHEHEHEQQHQHQHQQHPHHQQQLGQQQQQSVVSQSSSLQYPEFKQFPIPDEEQMQKYNEQHEKYLQQQKYLSSRDPMAYYQQQQQQQPQLQYQTSQQQTTLQHQPYHQQYEQQQNYAEVQQPQYVAPKPVIQHSHPPSIPIHQMSQLSDSSLASASYGFPFGSSSAPPPKMYSVYEENDMTELQNNNYQTAGYDSLEKEAQEYLKFMNTNEYFLPKRDPNYKQQDEEHDRRQQYNLRIQPTQKPQTQTPVPYTNNQIYQQPAQDLSDYGYQNAYAQAINSHSNQQQKHQQQQYQQQHQQQSPQLFSSHGDSSPAPSYSKPIKASQLFYHEESAAPSSSQGESATVVRTSYQTGYNSNQFVVSSQDHKTSKYLGSGQNALVVSTQSPVSVNNLYSQVRQSPQQKSRTPEPIRFEFTERDAMVGGHSYTFAPTTGHLRYKAVEPPVTPKISTVLSSTQPSTTNTVLSTTLRAHIYHSHSGDGGVKPVLEIEDDPEDEDDMQHAGSNLYGRQPVASNSSNKSTHFGSTTETQPPPSPPGDQKDNEEYCERICAIVEDEHEEIVCGSDGYMYTSEAQMECYASCLHIDVTIQGKGSCSAR